MLRASLDQTLTPKLRQFVAAWPGPRAKSSRFLLLALACALTLCLLTPASLLRTSLFSPYVGEHVNAAALGAAAMTSSSSFIPPLRAQGRHVLNADGGRFKLASINWYGGSDELFVPGGLDVRHRSDIAKLIKSLGFNSVRMPYSDEMVLSNPLIPSNLLTANPDLYGLRALDIFEASVIALTDAGIAVIVNNHITQATWFTGMNLCDATWRNDYLGPFCRIRQTEEQWIQNWESVMSRFVNNTGVIGADLRNEIHGFWGTTSWSVWATAAENAGERLLAMQPEWLMIVEGLSSANDLSGVRQRPIQYSIPNRVVYSAHVYSWSGWGEFNSFSKRPYSSFADRMRKSWAYLLEENTAPVWLGEFGAPNDPGEGDLNYWTNLMRFLLEVDADFGYWAINPTKPHLGERESYSLVKEDWHTVVDDYRLKSLRQLMGISDAEKDYDDNDIRTTTATKSRGCRICA